MKHIICSQNTYFISSPSGTLRLAVRGGPVDLGPELLIKNPSGNQVVPWAVFLRDSTNITTTIIIRTAAMETATYM